MDSKQDTKKKSKQKLKEDKSKESTRSEKTKRSSRRSKSSISKSNKSLSYLNSQISNEPLQKFSIETANPETIKLLIDSPEIEIIIKALYYLSKLAILSEENALQLHNLNIIEKLKEKQFLQLEDLAIQQLSFSIVFSILKIDEEKFIPKLDYETIKELFDIARENFMSNQDQVIIENSSGIIVNVLNEPRISLPLSEDEEFIMRVFKMIEESAIENILYNNYDILLRLLQTSIMVKNLDRFPFKHVLLTIGNSENSKVRNIALDVLTEVVKNINDEKMLSAVNSPKLFDDLLKVIENTNEDAVDIDVHSKILGSLKELVKVEIIAQNFFTDELLKRLFAYIERDDSSKIEAIKVLCELSQHNPALENLYQFGFLNLLFAVFEKDLKNADENMCLGITRMYKHSDAYLNIIERNPMPYLLKILADDNRLWPAREIVVECIKVLISRSFELSQNLINNYFEKVAANFLNRKFGEITPDCIIKILYILNSLYKYPDLRSMIMKEDLAKGLLNAIKSSFRSAVLLSNLLHCASIFIYEETLQVECLANDIEKLIVRALNSPASIVKSAATIFIILSGKIKEFSDRFIEKEVLEKLLSDQKSLSTCETWSPAIETILRTNPSIKFCVHGRLDLTDITGPDFYVSKKNWKNFSVLCCILNTEVSPIAPLILVNYGHIMCHPSSIIKVCNSKQSNVADRSSSFSAGDYLTDWTYCRRPVDENLPRYLKSLKEMLEIQGLKQNLKETQPVDITQISERAKIIAEVVCNEMCGDRPGIQSNVCSEHAVMNHLNQIKCNLHCNIIPLGKIKFGAHFERAILFKSLADQVGLPCTLQQNIDGKILYNELPIVTTNSQNFRLKDIPIKHLVPSHIIDLMDNPGNLYPMNSLEAFRYLRLI